MAAAQLRKQLPPPAAGASSTMMARAARRAADAMAVRQRRRDAADAHSRNQARGRIRREAVQPCGFLAYCGFLASKLPQKKRKQHRWAACFPPVRHTSTGCLRAAARMQSPPAAANEPQAAGGSGLVNAPTARCCWCLNFRMPSTCLPQPELPHKVRAVRALRHGRLLQLQRHGRRVAQALHRRRAAHVLL